ncbi:unnamed protein product [Durusdinium trenchii]|uniref:Tyrosine-protein kinase ephrin type A/B receptor-like domain-containing protein n=1 Tax=Durusdinium trenchii TaxID=1381693 RepID=A0ABP0QF28_9DINO
MVGVTIFAAAFLAFRTGVTSELCLPGGIPDAERKELSNGTESYPVGIFLVDYAAQHATAELVAILLQEKLGYKVKRMIDGKLTSDAFYALAGCLQPSDSSNRRCGDQMQTRAHISVEGWTSGYQTEWDELQRNSPSFAPRNLGNMGYQGSAGMFISATVQEKAYRSEGLSLDFYRDYNVSWEDPGRYFTRPQDINVSKLLPCEKTSLMHVGQMAAYLKVTGDHEGVIVQGDGTVIGRCFDGYFWRAPTCRSNASSCIAMISGGSGWSVLAHLQQATFHSMPLVWAVGSTWGSFTSLPMEYTTMFYWWTPDPTFLRLKAMPIIFPPYNRREYESGIQRTAAAAISIDKYVSQDLHVLAPEIEEFMSSYLVEMQDVDEIMLDQLESKESFFAAACRWLKANEDRWLKWLPDKTKCFPRYGLFSDKEEIFVKSRASETDLSCQPCRPGFFSLPLEDHDGSTFICQECDVGTYQVFGASIACDPCGTGEYQDETGSKSCKRCGFGEYQDISGQSGCKQCPVQTTTGGMGSRSIHDCGCLATTINMAERGGFLCQPCPKGLHCPFASSLPSLQHQVADPQAQHPPQVMEGYYSEPAEPLSLYKCEPSEHCPGGGPGECAGGLMGIPCAMCDAGQNWNGQGCTECQDEAPLVWAVILILLLLVLLKAYDFVESTSRAEASSFQACTFAAGIGINVVQNMAIFGLMSVRWSPSVSVTSQSLRVVLLDVDQLGLGCLTGKSNFMRFLASGLVFPLASIFLLSRWLASPLLKPLESCYSCPTFWPERLKLGVKPWKLYKTFNTIGALLTVGFATLSAVSLQPLMCYHHPNGKSSLVKYTGTFCGDHEQIIMVAVGMVLMVFALSFFVTCTIAVIKIPQWSAEQHSAWVQAFTFLTAKFRLDVWWFGLLLPIRGFVLSMVVVLATDQPELQVALASLMILCYLCTMVRMWPWKAVILNYADAALCSCLLLLVNQSPHFTTESETKFTEGFSLAIIALEAACLLLTAIVCIVAVISSYCGGSGTGVLNLGSANVTKISQALRHTATELLKIEAFYLQKRLCEMNNYDLERIKDVITLMSMDVFPDTTEQYRFHRRISLNVASRHSGFATPEMQSIPFSFNDQELVPHDLDQSEQSQRDEIEEDQQAKNDVPAFSDASDAGY